MPEARLEAVAVSAHRSIPLQSPYCGARHAIMRSAQSIRTEFERVHSDIHDPRHLRKHSPSEDMT
jgi:hypothetical protein